MYSTRPHRPKTYKTSPKPVISETNMAICITPSPSDNNNKASSSSSYYVRCVLTPHRAKRQANAYRAGMVVLTSLCLMGAVIWLISLAASINVLDTDSKQLEWLSANGYGYQPGDTITHDLYTMAG